MPSRRSFLASAGGAAGALSAAGCLDRRGSLLPGGSTPTIDAVEGDWPLPDFDPAGTRYDPDGRVPERAPGVAWTADLGADPTGVVVADGLVVAATVRSIHAFDAATGAERWRRAFPGVDRVAGPAVAGDVAYAATGGVLRAMAPADGSDRWTVELPADMVDGLAPVDGRVYLATEARSAARSAVMAVAEGGPRWSRSPGPDEYAARYGDIVVGADAVYAVGESGGSATGHVALDRADGATRWLATGLNHSAHLTLHPDALVAGGFYGHVEAQARADGAERWRVQGPGPVHGVGADAGGPVASFYGDDSGATWSLTDGGERRWTADRGGRLLGAGDAWVVARYGELVALERVGGDRRWRYRTRGWHPRATALADGVLFVGGDDGRLRALA